MLLSFRSVVAMALLLVPALARGASWNEKLTPESRAEFDRAIKLYNAQLYAQAAEAFRNAYLADPAPKLLFSIAQSQRLAGDCPQALGSYQAFLRTNPEDTAASLARENMALCQPLPVSPELPTPLPAVPPSAETDVMRAINAPVPPPAGRDVLTGVLLGTAGASVIGATIFAVLAHSAAGDRSASTSYDSFQHNNARVDTDRTLALSLGTIAVGCAGTAVWRLLHRTDD